MKKYDKIYEGILSNLAKKAGEKIKGGAEKLAGGVERVAKGVEKGVAKIPGLGSISKARSVLGQINTQFLNIVSDMEGNVNKLSELSAKAGVVKSKLIDTFEGGDKEVNAIVIELEKLEKASKSVVKQIKTLAGTAKSRSSEDYNAKKIGKETNNTEEEDVPVVEPVSDSVKFDEESYKAFNESWDSMMKDLLND